MTDEAPPTETAAVAASQAPMHRLSTATLIIGVPGSGKTSLYKTFAEYLWETYGRILLLYSWDGGAIPTDVQKRMKQGLIRFWRARTRGAAGLGLETLYLASKGYWPRRINAETGETSPAVEMVAPLSTRYDVSCKNGHQLMSVPVASLIVPMFCTPCGTFCAMSDLRVAESVKRTKGFELVGGVGFDGLTSMTDVVLDHMDVQRGEGNIGGEKPAFGGVVVSGGQKFGGNNRADIGFGQSRARQLVANSLGIPHLVEGPVFTGLAKEANDEGGLSIVGLDLPGQAATAPSSAWFGNVLETGKSLDEQGKSRFTLFLRPFTDKQNRRHLLKTSASPSGVPDALYDPPEEAKQPFTAVSLGNYFKMLDEDLRHSLLEDLPGAPGIPTEFMDYGEPLTVETASAAPSPGVQAGLPPLASAPGLVGPVSTPGSSPAPAANGMPLMVAKPRKKAAEPTVLPIPAATAAAASEPTAPVTQPVPASQTGLTPSSGTAPPPPPGRPPAKLPTA